MVTKMFVVILVTISYAAAQQGGMGQGDGGSGMGHGGPGAKSGLPQGACFDADPNCVAWSNSGECDKNPAWMKPNCALACRVCKNPGMKDGGKGGDMHKHKEHKDKDGDRDGPAYKRVPGFEKCLLMTMYDGTKNWCMPPAKPDACDQGAWTQLSASKDGVPPTCPVAKSIGSGVSVPYYLAVPGYEKCVKDTMVGGGNYQCLPDQKPDMCDKDSWALLVEGDPGYPPLLPSCGRGGHGDHGGKGGRGTSEPEPDDHVTEDSGSHERGGRDSSPQASPPAPPPQ